MFVSATDFDVPPYEIPNLNRVPNTFPDYVNTQEEEVLRQLLGNELYNAFIEGLMLDQSGDPEIEEKWEKLMDGAEYEYCEKTYKWVGMVALLKPYIFAMWTKHSFDSNTGIGVVQAKAENSKVISPSNRITAAYNKFCDLAGHYVRCELPYIVPDRELMTDVFGTTFFVPQENTLYGFLMANESDYEGLEFTPPEKVNVFNL